MARAIVIGSGFGGSVAALRLAEKGYEVLVLEQGRRLGADDFDAADRTPRRLLFMPRLGLRGFFRQSTFRHVGIVGGVGVGGGSLVYAAVLLRPDPQLFAAEAWERTGVDWQSALAPHLATAEQMLGATPNPWTGPMDEHLRVTAAALGAEHTYETTLPLGITFGTPGTKVADPHLGGDGPTRTACLRCGGCLTGCPYDAKNTLDRNYLWLAERRGVRIVPQRRAETVRALDGGGYEVVARDTFRPWRSAETGRADIVVVAAGVLGSLELLFRSRDVDGGLPHVSDELGRVVRTNSEAIVAALAHDPDADLAEDGPTITSHFHPDPDTHITQNRMPRGHRFMKGYYGPLVDGSDPARRRRETLATILRHPVASTRSLRARRWRDRITVMTVMQRLDNHLEFTFDRGATGRGPRRLRTRMPAGSSRVPSYLPVANDAARAFAAAVDGTPLNNVLESIGGSAITAHVLGGARIGSSPADGVVGTDHQVFGHPGLYVMDGSVLPGNVGVNPSLTITAMAERAAAGIEPAG